MTLRVRKSVKVLLLNEENELLLVCADDPKTTAVDKTYYGRFWYCVGGQMHPGESFEQAAVREIYEETGISQEDIVFGPIVWNGEFDMVLSGTLMHMDQTFLVAKTKKIQVSLTAPDEWEKQSIKKFAWFSLEKIQKSQEVIYPVVLSEYLPELLAGHYPKEPLKITLAKKPCR